MNSAFPATVSIDSLVKTFDGTDVALRGVSIDLQPGSLTALVGQSGSGKSTLLKAISGLVLPDKGSVEVFGQRIDKASQKLLRRLRSDIAFVFQGFALVGRLTALENVLMGSLGRLRLPRLGIASYPRAFRQFGMQCLTRVGLADFAFRRVDTLSGGQMQRVAVARALMQRPKLLLADEPIASLDPENAKEVMDLIATLCRQDNITALVSLHQLEFALSWSDRIIALKAGQVVLDGATRTLSPVELNKVYSKTHSSES
jgi:phosphonate transport system ATP-binding protein